MTSTERFFAALEFRTPDRIPRCDYFIGSFPDAWRKHKGFGAVADPMDYYGIDITEMVGDDISTVSKHLLVLKNAGLVASRREGNWLFYSLKQPFLERRVGAVSRGEIRRAQLPQLKVAAVILVLHKLPIAHFIVAAAAHAKEKRIVRVKVGRDKVAEHQVALPCIYRDMPISWRDEKAFALFR